MTSTYKFLQGGGEMGSLLRQFDFSTTTLGTPDTWPESLRSAISISLNSGFPIAIYWGEDFSLIYNDAWKPIPGNKHPWCIGKPGAMVWPEIWDSLKSQFKGVLSGSESIRAPDTLLLMNRYGYVEECYFDYTLSPITAVDGTVGGVFNAVIETSHKVIGDRRNKVIQNLLQQLNAIHSLDEGISTIIQIIESAREDIPFAMVFTTPADKADGKYFNAQTGIPATEANEGKWLNLIDENKAQTIHIANLNKYLTSPVLSPWGEPCTEALMVPISTGNTRINGYMVLGISPRKKLDDDYRNFLTSAAVHVGTILNNGYAYAQEEKNIRRIYESENRFRDLVHQAPVAIGVVSSDNFIIENVNTAMLKIWGKGESNITGKSYFDLLPELKGSSFEQLMKNVMSSGQPYYGNEAQATLYHNGIPTTGYFNFIYHPLKNEDGKVTSMMMVATEVTTQVMARQNEQAINEELTATNEELHQSQDELQEVNRQLEYSRVRLDNILNQLPIPITVLDGPDHIISVTNQTMLKHWHKTFKQVTGKPLLQVFPELINQPFAAQYKQVFETGKSILNKERSIEFKEPDGERRIEYVDNYYEPLKDVDGNTTAVLATIVNVTDKVEARKKVEQSEAEQQLLNQELSDINEKMTASNEELVVTNEELAQSQEELRSTLEELAHGAHRLKNMIVTTPIGMTVLRGRDLVIETANAPMLAIWNRTLQQVEGNKLVDVFPDLDGQPFPKLLTDVFDTGIKFAISEIEADIASTDGSPKHVYITLSYDPLFDTNGKVEAILATVNDITDIVEARKKLEKAQTDLQVVNEELYAINEEMTASNEELVATNEELAQSQAELRMLIDKLALSENRLKNVISTTPIGMTVLRGHDWVIESANTTVLEIWDRNISQVEGKKIMDVFPELEGQPFPALLTQVFDTGERVAVGELSVKINTADGIIDYYVDFSYDPLFDINGRVEGILVTVKNITEIVEARKAIENARAIEQVLNEELSAINEEMVAANEELLATNEELAQSQTELNKTLGDLATSEAQLRYMLSEAPIAIAVMMGRDMVIESANKKVLDAWGKTSAIVGKTLKQAVPELIGQEFLDLLDKVYNTGVPFYGNEVKALLEHDGIIEEVYSNFVYHPVKDIFNQTIGIMLVANVVTEQVVARKKVEQAEELLRFSIEAANIGTWYQKRDTREFIGSPRLKELYGFNRDEEVPYDTMINQIPEDYRGPVEQAIERALVFGDKYNAEYPINGRDGKRRWVRALGQLTADSSGELSNFSGILIDITEQKEDEIRKNDFIGMVSHELKTPLTSLSAIVQMVEGKARKADDAFVAGALSKAHTQVKKMTGMINGFLNISRLESGKLVINKNYFRLDELIREIVEENKLTSPNYNFTFICNETVNIDADQDKIGSVVSNLISNAVKYSPKGNNIEVRCKKEADLILVSVSDEGMGIKPHDIEKLFDRYYRVDSHHTQHISGFGIGLYLSAEIIKGHNGKIWVESESGVGSTFHFSLPV